MRHRLYSGTSLRPSRYSVSCKPNAPRPLRPTDVARRVGLEVLWWRLRQRDAIPRVRMAPPVDRRLPSTRPRTRVSRPPVERCRQRWPNSIVDDASENVAPVAVGKADIDDDNFQRRTSLKKRAGLAAVLCLEYIELEGFEMIEDRQTALSGHDHQGRCTVYHVRASSGAFADARPRKRTAGDVATGGRRSTFATDTSALSFCGKQYLGVN